MGEMSFLFWYRNCRPWWKILISFENFCPPFSLPHSSIQIQKPQLPRTICSPHFFVEQNFLTNPSPLRKPSLHRHQKPFWFPEIETLTHHRAENNSSKHFVAVLRLNLFDHFRSVNVGLILVSPANSSATICFIRQIVLIFFGFSIGVLRSKKKKPPDIFWNSWNSRRPNHCIFSSELTAKAFSPAEPPRVVQFCKFRQHLASISRFYHFSLLLNYFVDYLICWLWN